MTSNCLPENHKELTKLSPESDADFDQRIKNFTDDGWRLINRTVYSAYLEKQEPMQACTCQGDMAAYAKRLQRRKAEIKEQIDFAFKAKPGSVDEIVWLRHAVKGLFEQVFDEP